MTPRDYALRRLVIVTEWVAWVREFIVRKMREG